MDYIFLKQRHLIGAVDVLHQLFPHHSANTWREFLRTNAERWAHMKLDHTGPAITTRLKDLGLISTTSEGTIDPASLPNAELSVTAAPGERPLQGEKKRRENVKEARGEVARSSRSRSSRVRYEDPELFRLLREATKDGSRVPKHFRKNLLCMARRRGFINAEWWDEQVSSGGLVDLIFLTTVCG